MSRRLLLSLLLLLNAMAAVAGKSADATSLRASKPDVRKAILAAVEGQLAAFRKGDTDKAYGFAAAELRAQKPLRAFIEIVRNNYPEIWANTRAEFGIVRDDDQHATVTVQVYSKDGDAAYDFVLTKEKAGWRISSVLRHAPRQAGKV